MFQTFENFLSTKGVADGKDSCGDTAQETCCKQIVGTQEEEQGGKAQDCQGKGCKGQARGKEGAQKA